MEFFTNIEEAYEATPSAVSVGMFDGLHVGHRQLLAKLVAEARQRGLVSVLVTMSPHPRRVLSKGNDNVGMLSSTEELKALVAEAGVDRMVVIHFTRQFSDLTAEQFMQQWLISKLNAKYLLLGYNHRFGSDDLEPDDYVELAARLGLCAQRADVVTLPDGGKVSSSEVRKALLAADIKHASNLLGRPYAISGHVVHGDAIGRQLGYPTANILPDSPDKLIPASGVYAGRLIDSNGHASFCVINIGSRPTIGGGPLRIEAHIIGESRNLYDSLVRVELTDYLRPEQHFASTQELSEQIARDEKTAARILGV